MGQHLLAERVRDEVAVEPVLGFVHLENGVAHQQAHDLDVDGGREGVVVAQHPLDVLVGVDLDVPAEVLVDHLDRGRAPLLGEGRVGVADGADDRLLGAGEGVERLRDC